MTELIPLYIVIESKFVKIFTMEYLVNTRVQVDDVDLFDTEVGQDQNTRLLLGADRDQCSNE